MQQHLCNTVVIMQHKTRNVHPPLVLLTICSTPPHHLIYIYMFNFIYTSPPIFISPFFFLNFFCTVINMQQMMPRVQTILKPRTSPFVRAYGGIASFFFGKIFYETL